MYTVYHVTDTMSLVSCLQTQEGRWWGGVELPMSPLKKGSSWSDRN